MRTPKLMTLLRRKQLLEEELDQLAYQRSLLKTQAERLKQIPEAVRITGTITDVEREIEKRAESKTKQGAIQLTSVPRHVVRNWRETETGRAVVPGRVGRQETMADGVGST